ncbi:MAG: metal-dependent hydrolase [Mycobacterium sp.]
MLKPRRFAREIDPGPIQIHARKVEFDPSEAPLHWIPGHPVASHMVSLLNVVLPPAERWFVATYNEALPLVKDERLAEDMRGFIGQEAVHADTHELMLHKFMEDRGVDPEPILRQVDYIIGKVLAPSTSPDPKRRYNQLCERLWLIAAIEHYTAVLGDFALNSTWDDFGADPTMVDLFRWHGSEEVEHRCVAHDVATYFHDSYSARIRAMAMAATLLYAFFERATYYLCRTDPEARMSWWKMELLRMRDSKLGLLPEFRKVFGSTTLAYFRRDYSPLDVGSTAQAVAYLANSPAARAARI